MEQVPNGWAENRKCQTSVLSWDLLMIEKSKPSHRETHFTDRLGLCTEAWTALLRRRDFEEMTIEFSAAVSSRLKTLT